MRIALLVFLLGSCAYPRTSEPIRPGVPGKAPFWNIEARRFIYPPAFSLRTIEGATHYRFTCVAGADEYTFDAKESHAPLTPIWKELPVGTIRLGVVGMQGEKVLGSAGQRQFYRAAPYNGPYRKPVLDYRASARLALEKLFEQERVQVWLKTGKPDPTYELYRYPAKIMGAVVAGAALYAGLKPRPASADEVLQIGRYAADYLIGLHLKEGSPLQDFPPTYHGYPEILGNAASHMHVDRNMLIYPAESANAYLDFYDVTGEIKYRDAAIRIADRYKQLQLDSGTWYQFVDNITGLPITPNLLVPTIVINFFDRLERDYQRTGYAASSQRAIQWVLDNPVKTFNWQAQFEDARPTKPYVNTSREQACDFAIYLLEHVQENPENLRLAETLIRFSEDQFVVWERPMDYRFDEKRPEYNSDKWISPSVQEQYGFWMPVTRSAGIQIRTYQKAYETTGNRLYLEKAQSIANALTEIQTQYDGRYPTFFMSTPLGDWINNVVYSAKDMIALGRLEQ